MVAQIAEQQRKAQAATAPAAVEAPVADAAPGAAVVAPVAAAVVAEVAIPAAPKDGFIESDPTTWGTPGRNDSCPCGSGKKFKHCHGAF